MIEREIRYIVNQPSLGAGDYVRWSRACVINFDEFYINDDPDTSDEETNEWYVAAVAAAIIQGATFGRMESWGIPHDKQTRERIERMCVMRARQFLSRLQSDTYELMEIAPTPEPGGWASYWTPERRRERKREAWAHYWPQIRALWRKK